jgi:hypothetical protein
VETGTTQPSSPQRHQRPPAPPVVRGIQSLAIWTLHVMLPVCSALVVVGLILEFFSNKTVVPGAIFLVLISLSSLALGWGRDTSLSADERARAHFAGVALFVSALLTVASLALMWFSTAINWTEGATGFHVLTVAHILILALALALSCIALHRLIRLSGDENTDART